MAEEDERPRPDRRRPTRVYAPVFQRLGLTLEDREPPRRPGDRPPARPAGPAPAGPRRARPAGASRSAEAAPAAGPAGGAARGARSREPEPAVHLDDFTQAVVNRVIKTRQRGWQPDHVRKAVAAVDTTLVRELALGEDGAIGGDFESVADHLDFLRAAGDAWTGRAVAVAARRVGLSEPAARLAGRIAARLPDLRHETQLWACALVLRVIDAAVRAELTLRTPDARSRGDVTEPDIARRVPAARRQVLTPSPGATAPRPSRSPRSSRRRPRP